MSGRQKAKIAVALLAINEKLIVFHFSHLHLRFGIAAIGQLELQEVKGVVVIRTGSEGTAINTTPASLQQTDGSIKQ